MPRRRSAPVRPLRPLRLLLVGGALAVFVWAQWTPNPDVQPGAWDKWGHASLYCGLALLLWRILPTGDPLARGGAVVSVGFLVGLVMEEAQAGIPGRHSDPLDALANLGGLASAALAMGLAARWRTAKVA